MSSSYGSSTNRHSTYKDERPRGRSSPDHSRQRVRDRRSTRNEDIYNESSRERPSRHDLTSSRTHSIGEPATVASAAAVFVPQVLAPTQTYATPTPYQPAVVGASAYRGSGFGYGATAPRHEGNVRGRYDGPSYNNSNYGYGTQQSSERSDFDGLVPFEKNFYHAHPSVSARSDEEVQAFRATHEMHCIGKNVPKPIQHFEEACFPAYVYNQIVRSGFKGPTPIQCQGWPMAMSGQDIVGVAKTGSGKTLAYLLPGIVHINAQPPVQGDDGPVVLILAPTRELALQIHSEAVKFGVCSHIKSTCVYGGGSKHLQIRDLRGGVEICVATPGRLIDLCNAGKLKLNRVTYLVMDEADRMLDMGFLPQIQEILAKIRPDRQLLMWSATWPKEVQALAENYLNDYNQVNVGSNELSANASVKQIVNIVEDYQKKEKLFELLQNIEFEAKIIVFTATKRMADEVCRDLAFRRYSVDVIHGDKVQFERDNVISKFRSGKIRIMVATDVAARGLDVKDVQFVINYDMSNNMEDYVHRIGRTGRAESLGTAYTFFSKNNSRLAKEMISVLEKAGQVVPDALKSMRDLNRSGGFGHGGGRNGHRFGASNGGGRYSPYGMQSRGSAWSSSGSSRNY